MNFIKICIKNIYFLFLKDFAIKLILDTQKTMTPLLLLLLLLLQQFKKERYFRK